MALRGLNGVICCVQVALAESRNLAEGSEGNQALHQALAASKQIGQEDLRKALAMSKAARSSVMWIYNRFI